MNDEEEKTQAKSKKKQKPVVNTMDVAKSVYIPRDDLAMYGINKKML